MNRNERQEALRELGSLDGNRKMRQANRKRSLQLIDALTADRPCGECSACCTKISIAELHKSEGVSCRSLAASGGCVRYASRPQSCKTFYCLWKTGAVAESERPDKSGFVLMLAMEDDLKFMLAMADTKEQIRESADWLEELALLTCMPVVCRVPQDPEYFAYGAPEQVEAVRVFQERKNKRLGWKKEGGC